MEEPEFEIVSDPHKIPEPELRHLCNNRKARRARKAILRKLAKQMDQADD